MKSNTCKFMEFAHRHIFTFFEVMQFVSVVCFV